VLLFRGVIRDFFLTGSGLSVEDETFRLFFGERRNGSARGGCRAYEVIGGPGGEGGEVGIGEDETDKTSVKLACLQRFR